MNEHGGYFGNKTDKIADFSVNINPLGVPSKLLEELTKELPNLIRYPEIDGKTAKETLSKHLNKEASQIILGNGATELIYLVARAIKANKVLIIQPTFTEYERAFKVTGSNIYHFCTYEKDRFYVDMLELLEAIESLNPQIVVLCNPNNPTGVFYEPNQLKPLLDTIRKRNSYLFVDESFIDFTEKISLDSYVEDYPIFILRSMTKTYGIPGLRLGYGIGSKELISKLSEIKEPWTINSLALKAVDILLNDKDYFNSTKTCCSKEKNFLLSKLSLIKNIKAFPSEGNFVLCKLQNYTGKELKEALLKDNIYIRTCTDFKGLNDEFIRLAVRSREENEKLIDSLTKKMGRIR